MMHKEEFAPIFKKLTVAYTGRLSYDKETLGVWYTILRDLPVELAQAAALDYMSSPSAFPPTPGQIRAAAVELAKRINAVPSTAEAWEMVRNAPVDGLVRKSVETDTGWQIWQAKYEFEHAIVAKVARNLGWPKQFWTDNLVSDRARFMNAYEQELKRSTGEATSLPEVHAYIERGKTKDIKTIAATVQQQVIGG